MFLLYSEVPPSAALSSHIECYWQIRGEAARKAQNRVLPDGCMDVIFDLGDPQPSDGRGHRYTEYVVGAMREALVVEHRGRIDIMGIRFRPGCASSVLGVPAMELTQQVAALGEFWRDGGVIRERLAAEAAGAGAWIGHITAVKAVAANEARRLLSARAALLERVLLAQTQGALLLDPVVAGAVRLIRETRGGVAVKEMERQLGVSERTLLRRFAAAVGLTPKEASRVARFLAAARNIQRDPRISLAQLAAGAGYADQAHFTREFNRLAGTTPAAYARERDDGFVQDDSATGS